MTVSIEYILQNTNGEYEVVGLGTPDPLTTLEGIYGNRDWSFDLVFSGSDDITGDPISITSIFVGTSSPVLFTNTSNTVTLYKDPDRIVFPGEQYRFVDFETQEQYTLTDLTLVPANTSIIGWDTPSQEEITASYTFLITYDIPNQLITNQIKPVYLTQDLFWDFQPGFTKLQQQVANSEK